MVGSALKGPGKPFKKETAEGILEGAETCPVQEGIAGLRREAGRPGAGVPRRNGKTLATPERGMEDLPDQGLRRVGVKKGEYSKFILLFLRHWRPQLPVLLALLGGTQGGGSMVPPVSMVLGPSRSPRH